MPFPVAVFPDPMVGIPVSLALVASAIAFLRWIRIKLGGAWTPAVGARDGLIMVGVVVVGAILPIRMHTIAALLGLGILLGWFVLLLILGGTSAFVGHRVRRQHRRRARGEPVERYGDPVSDDVRARAEALRPLGFDPVTTITSEATEILLSFRADDSVVAEVAQLRKGLDQPLVLEFTSVLASRRAVLCTSTSSASLGLWPGEFRQAFPGAAAEYLLAEHRRALEFLAQKGLPRDGFAADDAVSVREEMARIQAEAVATAPRGTLRSALFSARGASRHVGRLHEQPDIGGQLDRFCAGLRARPGA